MARIAKLYHNFTRAERLLWLGSAVVVTVFYAVFDGSHPLTLLSSLIGVSYLIFNARGNPIGQVLVILFSLLYGYISWTFAYYGEMVTYLGMTMPMAVIALIAWLKNPFQGNRAEVEMTRLAGGEIGFMFALAAAVTVLFYFILRAFHTANLLPSTLSVTTSFLAVYLTARRSPWYAVAYAMNDVVLLVLWTLASLEDTSYVSVLACFAVFLVNDIYSFFSWRRIRARQQREQKTPPRASR